MARQFVRTGLSPRQGIHRMVRPMLVVAAGLLLFALAGGLTLLGVLPMSVAVSNAAMGHGALMIGGLFGTVIGLERAVALREPWSFGAPAAFAAGGLITVLGMPRLGTAYFALGAAVFLAVNVALLRRQRAAHTAMLVAAAVALLLGFVAHGLGGEHAGVLALWFVFLLWTIAAERLEMARLLARRARSDEWLYGISALMAAGALGALVWPSSGAAVFGVAVVALALWLMRFDIARHTVRTEGLSRYMATCLLAGYGWLAIGGIAWTAQALGVSAAGDIALHAIGLGFVVAMVMAHAPVILPAIAGIKVAYHPGLVAPLAVLQASLLLRLAGGLLGQRELLQAGAVFNVLALVSFAVAMTVGAGRWKRLHPARPGGPLSPTA